MNEPWAQFVDFGNGVQYNLCGPIALSMIAAITSGDLIESLWRDTQTEGPTDGYKLLYAALKNYPGNWKGVYFGWSQSYSLQTQDIPNIQLNQDGSLPDGWYFQIGTFGSVSWSGTQIEEYGTQAHIALRKKLLQNHYLVILANLSVDSEGWGTLRPQPGIPHWVVISGLSDQFNYRDEMSRWNWVRINNPFNNRTEYYPWKDFKPSISTGTGWSLIELWRQ